MSLATKSFIKTLIDSGADASLNLFTMTFRPKNLKDKTEVENAFSCRITNVSNLYQRDNAIANINYQNVTIPKISSGVTLPKTLSFSMRLDDEYYIWDKLRQLQSIDNFGNVTVDESKLLTITIDTYKPASSGYTNVNKANGLENLYSQYRWTFNNCYITSLSAMNYDYGSSGTGTTTVTFIWETYTEGVVNEQSNEELKLISGSLNNVKEKLASDVAVKQYTMEKLFPSNSVKADTNSYNLDLPINSAISTVDNKISSQFSINEGTKTTRSEVSNLVEKSAAKQAKTTNSYSSIMDNFNVLTNTSTVKAYANDSLQSYDSKKASIPSKSATDLNYNSNNTKINAIQKKDSIRTSTKETKPTITVLDVNSYKTKTNPISETSKSVGLGFNIKF